MTATIDVILISNEGQMVKAKLKPWSHLRISLPGRENESCKGFEFSEVRHIAHLPQAKSIIRSGHICSTKVTDRTVPGARRLDVSWLSANSFSESIYGNVAFSFPWARLIEGKKLLWLGENSEYGNPTYRFLVTGKRRSQLPKELIYDPSHDKGPLRLKKGKWYFLGTKRVSELLFDGDIPLKWCSQLDILDHTRGCHRGGECPTRNLEKAEASSKLMAFILAGSHHAADHMLMRPSMLDSTRRLSHILDVGLQDFLEKVGNDRNVVSGPVSAKPIKKMNILRKSLMLFSSGKYAKAREQASLFSNSDGLERAIEKAVNSHLGTDKWRFSWNI